MDWKSYMIEVDNNANVLDAAMSEVNFAYKKLGGKCKEAGVLDYKTKELIALSLATGLRCEPCIGFHARALGQMNASREEVSEALSMVILMSGGPGHSYVGKALQAYDQLKK